MIKIGLFAEMESNNNIKIRTLLLKQKNERQSFLPDSPGIYYTLNEKRLNVCPTVSNVEVDVK